MWSEYFGRVAKVAEKVETRGVPFRMTLDHSHVIFKIDNPEEQEILGMRADVDSGAVVLDPDAPGNVCDLWIGRGWVWHCHARAAVPKNPKHIWGRHEDGSVGRGIQHPFQGTRPGESHSTWEGGQREPCNARGRKLVTRQPARADTT